MKEEQGQEQVSTSVVNLEDRIVSKEDDMMAAFERQRFYLLRSPLWKRVAAARKLEYPQNDEPVKLGKVQADTIAKVNVPYIKGVKPTLIAFLFYCGVDFFILWRYNGGQADYGFITLKVSNRLLIRYGQLISIAGGIILLLPLPISFSLTGFVLIGLGLAPIYPGLLHETPSRFGRENSAKLCLLYLFSCY